MARFINPFTDTGFKIIFGKEHVSEELLVSFLTGLFANDPVLSTIKTVKYLPSERVREWDEGKSIVYDIHCQTSTGHKFILEMQLNEQEYFLKRAFYYFCRGIAEQGYKGLRSIDERLKEGLTKQADLLSDDTNFEKAENEYTESEKSEREEKAYWDYDFIPVVGVIFSNFFIKGLDRKLVTFMRMTDSETKEPIGDFLHAAFIQLPAFDKRKEDCKTLFDEWMYNLTHMATMETMAFTSHQDIFKRLAKVANLATLSPAERRQYDYDLKKARDYHNEMKFARKEAFSEGEAKGRAEGEAKGEARGIAIGEAKGKAEGKVEVALNMKREGMSPETISKLTGLSVTEVEAL